jgi:hypothetical protein
LAGTTIDYSPEAPFEPEDVVALERLAHLYWWMNDNMIEVDVARLFTGDGTLVLGPIRLRGLDAIGKYFAERKASYAAGRRTTRHLPTSILATPIGEGRAEVRSVVLLYGGNGDLPLKMPIPNAIADFIDVCVRLPDGGWRYESRRADTLFVGTTGPLPGVRPAVPGGGRAS